MTHLIRVLTLLALSYLAAAGAMAGEATSPAASVIERFYRAYLPKLPAKVTPPFSRAFQQASAENARICDTYAKENMCGWAAEADPYLDAQDHADKLTYENSGMHITEPKPGIVEASFNLMPPQITLANQRTITYHMVQEQGVWVVDDISYGPKRSSVREMMRLENKAYK